MKIGIMGCGVISKQYIQDIQRLYRELEICMVADVHSDVAERTAQQYNILRWGTPDELLNDTDGAYYKSDTAQDAYRSKS